MSLDAVVANGRFASAEILRLCGGGFVQQASQGQWWYQRRNRVIHSHSRSVWITSPTSLTLSLCYTFLVSIVVACTRSSAHPDVLTLALD